MKGIGVLLAAAGLCALAAMSTGIPLDEQPNQIKPDILPAKLPDELKKPTVLPGPCTATCRKLCQFGFLEDGNCPRCTCAPNPCDTAKCADNTVCTPEPSKCAGGLCPHVASCKGLGLIVPKEEPKETKIIEPCHIACFKKCDFGFLEDGSCPRCTCAPNPCDTANCPDNTVCTSKASKCDVGFCPHIASCKGLGLIVPTEEAKETKPCLATCRKHCEFGFLDDGNCPRCTCAPNPCDDMACPDNTECKIERPMGCDGDCPILAICNPKAILAPVKPNKKGPCEATAKKFCPYGFKSRGCPRSKCAPDPCMKKKCRNGKICTSKPRKCPFKSGCPHRAVCVKGPIAVP